jgi:N-hydroxyarylamine O-acetyltransferase
MDETALDLEGYLDRIDFAGAMVPTLETLQALHLAHAKNIPFENLDIQLGRAIKIDLASIQEKIVRAGRGGYCFEQNTLFAAVLERVGFCVTRLAARVRKGATRVLPRTHMLLEVPLDGASWLVDVGFGTGGPLLPIAMMPGLVSRQYTWSFRVVEEPGLWVLQSLAGGIWHDLYEFTREPQHAVDFEMANYYVSTNPNSRFVQTLAVQRQTPDACYLLRNRELTIIRGDAVETRQIDGDEALLHVLSETFGLEFPPGTQFRCLAAAPPS